MVVEEDMVVVKEDMVEEKEEEEMWDNMVRGDLIGTTMITVLIVVILQIIIIKQFDVTRYNHDAWLSQL